MFIRIMVASVSDPMLVHLVCGTVETDSTVRGQSDEMTRRHFFTTCCNRHVERWGLYEVPGPTMCLECIAEERT